MVTMSVLGLYNWDPSLFDDMAVPEGVEKETIINNILLECAELETLFPDPYFCKSAIKAWSDIMLPTWNRIKNAISIQYNPLENYDRTETENGTNTNSRSDTRTSAGTNGSTGSETTTESGTDTNKVSSFDAAALQDGSAINYGKTTGVSSNVQQTITSQDTANISDNGSTNRTSHIHGNIGVTTSQQMLQAEIDIAVSTNLAIRIMQDFKTRFCILVY